MRLDFVGVDPDNPSDDCPAVFVDPETGDFYLQGETVTDPGVLAWINSDSRILLGVFPVVSRKRVRFWE